MARYIDAEALDLYDSLFMSEDTINKSGVYVRYRAVENLIKNAPTADVQEVKHGRWIKVSDKAPKYCCTKCNHLYNNKEYKHCPFCGANMDGEEKPRK